MLSPPSWRLVIQSLPVVVSSFFISPTIRGSGLVDLLVAGRCVYGAHVDGATHLIELKLGVLPSEVEHVYRVLCVAGVGHPLHAHALVGVIARLGDIKGLPHVPALGLLLDVLVDPVGEEGSLVEVTDKVSVEVLAELLEELVEATVKEEAEVLLEVLAELVVLVAEVVVVAVSVSVCGHGGGCGQHHRRHRHHHRQKHHLPHLLVSLSSVFCPRAQPVPASSRPVGFSPEIPGVSYRAPSPGLRCLPRLCRMGGRRPHRASARGSSGRTQDTRVPAQEEEKKWREEITPERTSRAAPGEEAGPNWAL